MTKTPRTSHSHPLQIAEATAPGGGVIGITFCPGKHQSGAMTGSWARDVAVDVEAIKAWGAVAVVTLVTEAELEQLKAPGLGPAVVRRDMVWFHLPIDDVSTPTAGWELSWRDARPALHEALDRGQSILVHCKGGLGRAGMVAARLLIERGVDPVAAIRSVRGVRRGAIETTEQERYLQAIPEASRWPIGPREPSND